MKPTEHIKSIMSYLMDLMIKEQDMKKFKNMAAIYVMWQTELHYAEIFLDLR